MLHLSTKWADFKFDACHKSKKKLAQGQQRAEKARHFEKIQLGEHLATNYELSLLTSDLLHVTWVALKGMS